MKTNKKYKALMLDLDGTTIPNRPDGMPSKRVVEAIRKAQKKIFVGVATSRPYYNSKNNYNAKHIIDYMKLTGPCIVNNGAQVIDGATGAILREQTMLYADIIAVCREVKKLKTPLLINTKGGEISIEKINQFQDQILGAWTFPPVSEKIADLLIDRVSHISTIAVSKAPANKVGKFHVVINHAIATKQHGILEVARILGINTHEIIGVGDGDNDFPLLMACGLRIAMGNAVDELKEIADYIAPPVMDDGVVDVMNRFVLNGKKL